ncbi:hypothetical protein AgCh_033802 [Apium graveolens]
MRSDVVLRKIELCFHKDEDGRWPVVQLDDHELDIIKKWKKHFTTQTLLNSVGVSRNRSTPGAVAINWILKVYDTAGTYLYLLGSGYFWLPMVLLSEIVQTFILADFCYYYVKSVVNGQLLVSLPPV